MDIFGNPFRKRTPDKDKKDLAEDQDSIKVTRRNFLIAGGGLAAGAAAVTLGVGGFFLKDQIEHARETIGEIIHKEHSSRTRPYRGPGDPHPGRLPGQAFVSEDIYVLVIRVDEREIKYTTNKADFDAYNEGDRVRVKVYDPKDGPNLFRIQTLIEKVQ